MNRKNIYNLAMVPLYATWRVISRVLYLGTGWWLIKRVLGMKTGNRDLVSKSLHR